VIFGRACHTEAMRIVPEGFERFDGVGMYLSNDHGMTTAFFDDVLVRALGPFG